jgi:ATP-dependent exoDNAse (exonuclease V) beta subunit
LAERFDLLTGQPRHAPASGGVSILTKYLGQLPDILVHHAAPEPIDLKKESARRPPALSRFRELIDQSEPDSLPESVGAIPPDWSARRRFSVSEIEAVDAELRAVSSDEQRPQPARHANRSERLDDDAPPMSDLSAAEQLGTLVHAALERIDFQNPQRLAALIDGCCGFSVTPIGKPARAQAMECLENLLASPLCAELAAARQIHREIDFLLSFPSRRGELPPRIISGTIDCLFESADGTWSIVDYKTGVRDKTAAAAELLADYEIQLGLYALATRQFLNRIPERIELAFIRQGVDRVVFEPTESRLADVRHRVEQALESLMEQNRKTADYADTRG